jgi:hypothetical protein
MNTGVIEQLQPKTYLYNSDPDAGMQIGYIAEQVSDIHHHFALYGGDGKPSSIDYNVIVVFLVEEVKKLKKEVELQQQMIESQQQLIDAYLARK